MFGAVLDLKTSPYYKTHNIMMMEFESGNPSKNNFVV